MSDNKVTFRNRRGTEVSNTAADFMANDNQYVGTRYDVHRVADDRHVGKVEKVDGLWRMFLNVGSHMAPVMNAGGIKVAWGGNRLGCGEMILGMYERDVEPTRIAINSSAIRRAAAQERIAAADRAGTQRTIDALPDGTPIAYCRIVHTSGNDYGSSRRIEIRRNDDDQILATTDFQNVADEIVATLNRTDR